MAKRPFSITHEAYGIAQEYKVKAISDLAYYKEVAIGQEADIEQYSAAIEELLEEQDNILVQMKENETKIEEGEVTPNDVEVSEECRRQIGYKLGLPVYNTIRLSNEATHNAVRSEPQRWLVMSNEGLGDFFKKIWEKIKAFFRKIGEFLGLRAKSNNSKSEAATDKAKETKKKAKESESKTDKGLVQLANEKGVKLASESYVDRFYVTKEDQADKIYNVLDRLFNQNPVAMLMLLDKGHMFKETIDENGAYKYLKQYEEYLKYYLDDLKNGDKALLLQKDGIYNFYKRLCSATGGGYGLFNAKISNIYSKLDGESIKRVDSQTAFANVNLSPKGGAGYDYLIQVVYAKKGTSVSPEGEVDHGSGYFERNELNNMLFRASGGDIKRQDIEKYNDLIISTRNPAIYRILGDISNDLYSVVEKLEKQIDSGSYAFRQAVHAIMRVYRYPLDFTNKIPTHRQIYSEIFSKLLEVM